MKAVLQRVTEAGVSVDGDAVAADFLARKTATLRIFDDEAGKMNRSVADIGGAALVVSQFTLAADTSRGNRPSYARAASPEAATVLYDRYCELLAEQGVPVARGVFAARMMVRLVNDGSVTI